MNTKSIAVISLALSIISIIAVLAIAAPLTSEGIVTLGKPSGCNYDGSCQGWESADCSDCTGNTTTTVAITTTTIVSDACGDGYCAGEDLGEDCKTCPADCPGRTTGAPSGRYCCGNYGCEIVGEDSYNCPIDCGEPPTTTTTIPNSCNDTDGGWNTEVKGTTSGSWNGNSYSYTDYCEGANSTWLMEYYCSGTNYGSQWHDCVGNTTTSCSNGACV